MAKAWQSGVADPSRQVQRPNPRPPVTSQAHKGGTHRGKLLLSLIIVERGYFSRQPLIALARAL